MVMKWIWDVCGEVGVRVDVRNSLGRHRLT